MSIPARRPPVSILENGSFQSGVGSWHGTGGSEQLTALPASPFGSPHGPPTSPSISPNSLSYASETSAPSTCPAFPLSEPTNAFQSPSTLNITAGQSRGSSDAHSNPNFAPAPLAGPTGAYLVVSNRKDTWQGPYQEIANVVQLFVTYAVTAWVRIGSPDQSPALISNVDIALNVDNDWVNVGMVESDSRGWVRCVGSFRLEKKPTSVRLYLQGPAPGVDIWLADIRAVPQEANEELTSLKQRADQVRKRDININITSSSPSNITSPIVGASVKVKQLSSAFPIGSCLSLGHINSPEYRRFFSAHFDFAVFENEFKWARTEWDRGNPNFEAVDTMLTWLEGEKIPVRGHCIFWDNEVPPWLPPLPDSEFAEAVDKRVVDLLSRYKGRFAHYDVNNEMLHGGFFANRLGPGIITRMFQLAKKTDPSALLFVNDYSVEDGKDWRASPRKYLNSIMELLRNGAPVDAIGIQGHISNPVVTHVLDALDILAEARKPNFASTNNYSLNTSLSRLEISKGESIEGGSMKEQSLPIWFTEMDVASSDDRVRADDFEMMLRTAYAHPAVEGVVLWGFWKGCEGFPTCRVDAGLVEGDWTLNEGGRRLEMVLNEWRRSEMSGTSNENGQFYGRGHCGRYEVQVEWNGKVQQMVFDLERGSGPKEINIVLGMSM